MILSNAAYAKLRRQKSFPLEREAFETKNTLDWLLFTNLNAHEVPGQSIELEE